MTREELIETICEEAKRRGLDWKSGGADHHGTTHAVRNIWKVTGGVAQGMAVGRAKERAAGSKNDRAAWSKAAREQRFSRYPKRRKKI